MSDDLLTGYRKVSSFALWDGEDLGISVHLLKHSNENYAHQEGTDTVFRVGLDSTLAKWIADGGIKEKQFDIIYKVDMRKSSGYGLRIEGRDKVIQAIEKGKK